MAPLRRHLALWAVVLVAAADPAAALEGRYLGSLQRSEGPEDVDVMQHLYDIGGRRALPAGLDLRLRTTLRYQSLPGTPDSDLLRSRFQADLSRGSLWRAEAQLVPWQRQSPGDGAPREREAQLGLRLTPQRGPRLTIQYARQDREAAGLRSFSDSRRIGLAYARAGVSTEVGYRSIDATPAGAGSASHTEEWRGGVRAQRSFGRASVQGGYDALLSHYSLRERRRDQWAQRADAGASWSPAERVTLTASIQEGWGHTRDNTLANVPDLDERSWNGSVQFRPWDPLTVEASRQYRSHRVTGGKAVSDYVQFQSTYRQEVRRGFFFQSGYLGVVDLRDEGGAVPQDAAYGLVDGSLWPGVQARAELRAARGGVPGTTWRQLLQARTRPTPTTRFDATWSRNTLPADLGEEQRDREWEITGGWEPAQGASAVLSWRALDGEGRIDRRERTTSLVSSVRLAQRTVLSANASRRTSQVFATRSDYTVAGVDLTFWMPRELQVRTHWTAVRGSDQPERRSYGVSVEKRF